MPRSATGPKASAAEARAARKELDAIERKIERLARHIDTLHERMAGHDHSDYAGLAALDADVKAAEAETEALETQWLELSELAG